MLLACSKLTFHGKPIPILIFKLTPLLLDSIHLKLKLLSQFPALNYENMLICENICIGLKAYVRFMSKTIVVLFICII